MRPDSEVPGDAPFAAEKPHCGVCRHVHFGDDWERTPHCAEFEQSTAVRPGAICSKFTLE